MSEEITREYLIKLVEEINGAKYDPNDPDSAAIMFLVTAGTLGTTNYTKIAAGSGLPFQTCARFGRAARGKRPKSEKPIFVGTKIDCEWDDPECGGIALITDALCLNGFLNRVHAP